MTQDEIIEMAKQAKLGFLLESGFMCHQEVKDFAKLVAAKEREACAKICDDELKQWGIFDSDVGDVSKAIRARGQA
jgi:hypothetical protein